MKKLLVILITLIITVSVSGQTFVITEVIPVSEVSQKDIKEANEYYVGIEVILTISDNDIRIKMKDSDRTELLKKVGDNLYRKENSNSGNWDNYQELKLDTFLGYIKGFTYILISDKKIKFGIKAKRK